MGDIFHHLFIPRFSNNHRAKILHNSTLFLTIVFIVLSSFFIKNFSKTFPSILGISTDINIESLLEHTNQKRQENGIHPLKLDARLSEAASKKADDMFQYDYWAHNSPSGKTPWVFIKGAGYNYVYAGENLARGFTTTSDVINAWMESPTHRANMLSSNYQDVGFAVKIGQLNGEETVLIVEQFGNQNIPLVASKPKIEQNIMKRQLSSVQAKTNTNLTTPLIDSKSLSSNINKVILSVFIFTLIIDLLIIERKKILRFVGHNLDHVIYLLFILIIIGMLNKGAII